MSDPASPTYPVGVIAKLLLLTDRRVQQLTAEGVIPKAERGRYELAPAVQGYIRYLQERHLGREGDGGDESTIAAEKLRKLRADADMAEMERDKVRGTLQDTAAVAKVYSSRVMAARTKLLAMPTRLAPRLAEITDATKVEATIKAEVHAALRELGTPAESQSYARSADDTAGRNHGASPGGDGEGRGDVPLDGGPDVAPATGMDGQPMG